MQPDEHLTLAGPGEGLFKDRGSKFLAFAYPVEDAEQVRARLDELRRRFHDARHHCYAYRLGADGAESRANDDGEPSHSAGTPILGQLRSRELTDALVVVVRYFGGTKLGVPGLVNAYKTAAAEALDAAPRRVAVLARPLALRFPYAWSSPVMALVKELSLGVAGQDFQADCRLELRVRLGLWERVLARLERMPGVSIERHEAPGA